VPPFSCHDHLYGSIEEFQDEGMKSMVTEKLILPYEREIWEVQQAAKEAVKEAVNEGVKEAIEEAVNEAARNAEERKALDIAKKMLIKGIGLEDIAEFTTLPIDRIKTLQAQH
jgi:hypothetical protein